VNVSVNFSRKGVAIGDGGERTGAAKGFKGGTAGSSSGTGTGRSTRVSHGFWARTGALSSTSVRIVRRRIGSS
jgi:hypothetical protein